MLFYTVRWVGEDVSPELPIPGTDRAGERDAADFQISGGEALELRTGDGRKEQQTADRGDSRQRRAEPSDHPFTPARLGRRGREAESSTKGVRCFRILAM